jgi:hypothetical protein
MLDAMEDTAAPMRDEIRKEAERVHESAKYASETQFAYAQRWRRVDRWIGSASATLAAVAGIGGLSEVFSARWAGLIAVVAAGMGAIAASIGAPQTKENASGSATSYRALQQDTRVFLNIDLPRLTDDDAREQLRVLINRLQDLSRDTEIPSRGAWKRAKNSIEGGSQDYETDK